MTERTPLDPRTRLLLEAPIVPTLLRLGAPNVLVMLAQAAVGLIETFFVGKLGTDALAGMALVFPMVMLMQMTSAGAVGGGIASGAPGATAGPVHGSDRYGPGRTPACGGEVVGEGARGKRR